MIMIKLSDSSVVLDGLSQMLEAAIGPHDYMYKFVELDAALLIMAIAQRAPDKHEWFPKGKWATIQAIQKKIDSELNNFFA